LKYFSATIFKDLLTFVSKDFMLLRSTSQTKPLSIKKLVISHLLFLIVAYKKNEECFVLGVDRNKKSWDVGVFNLPPSQMKCSVNVKSLDTNKSIAIIELNII